MDNLKSNFIIMFSYLAINKIKFLKNRFLKGSILFIMISSIIYFQCIYLKKKSFINLFDLNGKNKTLRDFKSNLKNLKFKYHPDKIGNGDIFIYLKKIENYCLEVPYQQDIRYNNLIINYQLTNDIDDSLEKDFSEINQLKVLIFLLFELIIYFNIFLIIFFSSIRYRFLFFILSIPLFLFLILVSYEYFNEQKISFYYDIINEIDYLKEFSIYELKEIIYKLQLLFWILYYNYYSIDNNLLKKYKNENKKFKIDQNELVKLIKVKEENLNKNEIENKFFVYEKSYYELIKNFNLNSISKLQLFIDLFYIIIYMLNVYNLIF